MKLTPEQKEQVEAELKYYADIEKQEKSAWYKNIRHLLKLGAIQEMFPLITKRIDRL